MNSNRILFKEFHSLHSKRITFNEKLILFLIHENLGNELDIKSLSRNIQEDPLKIIRNSSEIRQAFKSLNHQMNVLIYSGSTHKASSASSNLHQTLAKILSSSYDVKLANPQLISQQPWQNHTSLLVFPNQDSLEIDNLTTDTRRSIREWVGRGGNLLGIGTGAVFAQIDRLGLVNATWDLLRPTTDLPHNPDLSDPWPFKTKISFHSTQLGKTLLDNQFGTHPDVFIDNQQSIFAVQIPPQVDQLTILAYLCDQKSQNHPVAIHSRYLNGNVILLGFDAHYALDWLTKTLSMIGLEGLKNQILHPEPSILYLMSCLPVPDVEDIHKAIFANCSGEQQLLNDTHHKFKVSLQSQYISQHLSPNDYIQLVLCSAQDLSLTSQISFELNQYFCFLSSHQHQSQKIGSTVLYAETLESTQTLLERNSKVAALLPSGTVVIAKKQTNGRGRGTNNWISTSGSVQFSVLLKISHNTSIPIVFVQYLFGLSVVEWIGKKFSEKLLVRLKWPNDIYGSLGGRRLSDYKKVGGILVNCLMGGDQKSQYQLVIGCGLNHQLAPQSTAACLRELIESANASNDMLEKLESPGPEEIISGILNCFEEMWNRFQIQGFQPFLPLYLSRWLHSQQIIKDERTGEDLKIIGISPTHGLLRTENVLRKQIMDFQPDSNSFDMFSGLIKSKE
ncbi:hypothetical protein O181_081481 [Austropuccinia psidii MF-1]|uniref:BPL/LPL catalytic domain-containing protein n=1 Tax=Austropuccinia psidii MF-1 TaxID=1389203 RepID=A0A9Q3IG01_9BASI|nr:hypothetical protein [Austropuccinia psidii MF-1]